VDKRNLFYGLKFEFVPLKCW